MAVKYQFIADELRVQIQAGKYAAATVLPTEYALCREYQVSRQTIRQALSLLAKDGLIEKRQGSGSSIVRKAPQERGQNAAVAVITTYISDYIFPHILQGVEAVLTANGSAPFLYATQNQVSIERKILQTLLTVKSLDGILVEGSKTALPNPNLDLYQKLIDRGVHLVFINGTYPELAGIPSVLADNRSGGRMLVEYLHQKGHQNIAGIFKSDDMQGHQRYLGYIQALRDLGLPLEDKHIFWYNTEHREFFLHESYLDRVLDSSEGCTAIVCYNDEVAIRIVAQLKKRGVRLPEDMAVVSFDNSRYSELAPVRITSLSHGTQNLGVLAAEQMLRLLRGETCQSISIPWQLIEKDSG